jgi:hypothetical protein
VNKTISIPPPRYQNAWSFQTLVLPDGVPPKYMVLENGEPGSGLSLQDTQIYYHGIEVYYPEDENITLAQSCNK